MRLHSLPLLYSLAPLLSGVTAAALAAFIWKRRPSRPAAALSLYLLSVAVWSLAYGIQLQCTSLALQTFWSKVGYVGPAGVSLAGLVFALQYAGLNDFARWRPIAAMAAIPALTQILVWTNERHGLIWARVWQDSRSGFPMMARTHGPWFWVFLAYGYVLCLISMFLLGREFASRRGIYRSQAAVLLLGCMVPFAGNALYSFGVELTPNLDLTVFGFLITGVTSAWGLFRFHLPMIMPLARQTVFEGMSDGVIALDTAGNLVEANPEACRVLGQPAKLLLGRHAGTALKLYPELAELCLTPTDARVELTLAVTEGERLFDVRRSVLKTSRQRVIGLLVVCRDITERQRAEAALWRAHLALEERIEARTADLSRTIAELRQMEDRLTFSASHDGLTSLPNRTLFLERVSKRLAEWQAGEGDLFAVLYADIDRFKVYNDGYGHHFGDFILKEMANRLGHCLAPGDMAARMGGDEFTILLHAVSGTAEAAEVAAKCLRALAAPAHLAGVEIQLTASIGIAVARADRAGNAEGLVRDADLAMYRAKRQGGNRIETFGESMLSSALSLVQLQQDLRLALLRQQIVVHYQPFVRIQTGTVVGFEALVRWRHPERGLLPPEEFLPIAEQIGMLMEIDEFVLEQACRQKACWQREAAGEAQKPFVSVNVSRWQFSNPSRWWGALSALDCSEKSGLRLEMLESVLATNAHAAGEFFEQVRTHNLPVYLDDFGTGYSSLSWLSHFPIHSLKIDRSFVQGLGSDGRAEAVIRAIVALASSLRMEVVAEGIEDLQQSVVLQALGCEFGQGFYFAPAVDAAAALQMLKQKTALAAAV